VLASLPNFSWVTFVASVYAIYMEVRRRTVGAGEGEAAAALSLKEDAVAETFSSEVATESEQPVGQAHSGKKGEIDRETGIAKEDEEKERTIRMKTGQTAEGTQKPQRRTDLLEADETATGNNGKQQARRRRPRDKGQDLPWWFWLLRTLFSFSIHARSSPSSFPFRCFVAMDRPRTVICASKR
jgi:hypothetical protein